MGSDRPVAQIRKFGFTNPVLITDDDQILAGHGRVEASKSLGMSEIPTVRLSQMTEAESARLRDRR
jgi:ParB-like chromosome segregation protein Spo0J